MYVQSGTFTWAAHPVARPAEPRTLQLHEITFQDDEQQSLRFQQLIKMNWSEPGERLLTSLASAVLDHALFVSGHARASSQGGLAAWQRRQLVDPVQHSLAEPISIGTGRAPRLSPYHFARMFH